MAGEAYVVESASTVDMAPRERTEFWSEHVSSYHCLMDFRYRRPDDFRGGTVRQRTDTYQLVRWWSSDVEYIRTPQQVRRDPGGDYRFLMPLTGELAIRQDDRETLMRPGTGSLITLGVPFDLVELSPTQALVMTIPAGEVDGPLNRISPLAAGLDLTSGLGRVVRDVLIGVYEERDRLTKVQFEGLCARVVELLCMLVVGDDRPDAPGHLAEVEAMVRRYVRRHAGDPELTVSSLAHELGWSLRQVQLALQRVGTTPREVIREERLRLARERLLSPAYRHMTITEVAHASGFSSVSALSTAYRQRFGMSPREARHESGH